MLVPWLLFPPSFVTFVSPAKLTIVIIIVVVVIGGVVGVIGAVVGVVVGVVVMITIDINIEIVLLLTRVSISIIYYIYRF